MKRTYINGERKEASVRSIRRLHAKKEAIIEWARAVFLPYVRNTRFPRKLWPGSHADLHGGDGVSDYDECRSNDYASSDDGSLGSNYNGGNDAASAAKMTRVNTYTDNLDEIEVGNATKQRRAIIVNLQYFVYLFPSILLSNTMNM